MNILVLIKQVPDTEASIRINGNKIDESSIKWIISPNDEVALEEGIRIKEKNGGTVTVISVGPERVVVSLRTAFAMGADNAIHIKADEYDMLDSYAIASSVAKATENDKFDIIFTGRQAIDSDNGQVPLILGELKNCGSIIWAKKVEATETEVKVNCEVEGGEAIYNASYPVIITAQVGLNEPRYPSLKGIMAAKKKPVETKNIADLGIKFNEGIEIIGYELPPQRPVGKIIESESTELKVKELIKSLHEELKVI